MNFSSVKNILRVLVVATVVLTLLPAMVMGQSDSTRSDTGRHKPEPKPVPRAEDNSLAKSAAAGASAWFVGIGGGFQGGGDLWHVETLSGAAVPWVSDVRFTSERFNASLESNFGMGLFVGRRMGPMWSLQADLSSTRMDVAAEALQGQQGAVFLYDRLTVTTVGLTGEVRLVRLESYPYVNAGVVWNRVSAAREEELDQNQLGLRLGLGYLKALNPEFSLRAEARFSRSGFDTGSFVPRSRFDNQPELEFEGRDHLSLFELILAVQLNLR